MPDGRKDAEAMENKNKEALDFMEGMTEAQATITCFELWQDMFLNGNLPDPNRYEKEVLDYYGKSLVGKRSPFYFMFMGFLGGLDFATATEEPAE